MTLKHYLEQTVKRLEELVVRKEKTAYTNKYAEGEYDTLTDELKKARQDLSNLEYWEAPEEEEEEEGEEE